MNTICLWNDRQFTNSFFRRFGVRFRPSFYTHFGVEGGAVCVLHTWGQNLSLHPHIHCIVPAAGYSLKGQWKNRVPMVASVSGSAT
ncbi:MAG: transposase [Bacteroidales bacterium]|nr:transposase [Bacteroidales bacterium]